MTETGRAKALGYTLAFATLTPVMFLVTFFLSNDITGFVLIATLLPMLASMVCFVWFIYRLIQPRREKVQS